MRDRWRVALAVVVAVYAALKLGAVLAAGPHTHTDTNGYTGFPVDLLGRSPRPWVPSLPMHALDGWGFVVFQALLSSFAFCVLAAAIASTVEDRRVKTGLVAVVLLLGLSPRTTAWDATLLSESMALSFTALLIACLVWLRRVPWWAFGAVFTLWLLTKEAHLYLGVLVLGGVAVWAWRVRQWAIPATCAAALLWGFVTYGNDNRVEHYNVTVNIAYHAGHDVDTFRWFIAEGMPPSDAFFVEYYYDRQLVLLDDAEFQAWVADDGEVTYAKFMVTHPGFTMIGPLEALFTNEARAGESLVDHSDFNMTNTLGVPFWPERATLYSTALLLVAVGLSVVVVRRRLLDGRWVLPGLLLGSTVPHAVLAYHAGPSEIARHGAELAFVLVLSCWWLIGLAVDALGRRPVRPVPVIEVQGESCPFTAGGDTVQHQHLGDHTVEEQCVRGAAGGADTKPVPGATVVGVGTGRAGVDVDDLVRRSGRRTVVCGDHQVPGVR